MITKGFQARCTETGCSFSSVLATYPALTAAVSGYSEIRTVAKRHSDETGHSVAIGEIVNGRAVANRTLDIIGPHCSRCRKPMSKSGLYCLDCVWEGIDDEVRA